MSLSQLVGRRSHILVKQVKEWAEILVGFETGNRYELFDADGSSIGYAAEEGGGLSRMLFRNVMGAMRACTIHLYDSQRNEIGRAVKPFRFFYHRMEVVDGDEVIGSIERKWAFFHRCFEISDADGNCLATIRSRWFRVWTFNISSGDEEVARISKKWGGGLREMFTDADTFGLEVLDPSSSTRLRTLLLAATFLIDFAFFENNTSSG